jgi:hypothetical protein
MADAAFICTQDKDHCLPAGTFLDNSSWEDLRPNLHVFSSNLLINTPHICPFVVAMAKLGYHILLEKPMAVTEDDCRKIKEVMINFFILMQLSDILYTVKR